jgi:hypothetical protein
VHMNNYSGQYALDVLGLAIACPCNSLCLLLALRGAWTDVERSCFVVTFISR